MTVDIEALRKTHVKGWKPRQSVQVEVRTLAALLDELDVLRRAADEAALPVWYVPVCEVCGRFGAGVNEAESLCERCATAMRAEHEVAP